MTFSLAWATYALCRYCICKVYSFNSSIRYISTFQVSIDKIGIDQVGGLKVSQREITSSKVYAWFRQNITLCTLYCCRHFSFTFFLLLCICNMNEKLNVV